MQPDKPHDTEKPDPNRTPSSPYGPHPGHVDDASGGADSSPFETMSSDERDALLKARQRDKNAGDEDESSRH